MNDHRIVNASGMVSIICPHFLNDFVSFHLIDQFEKQRARVCDATDERIDFR